MLSFLILTKIFEVTGSTVAASMLWIAYSLPGIIVGPFAATIVDQVDRKKALMISNLLQGLVILIYALVIQNRFVYVSYGIVLLYSLLNQFYVPAEAATLPCVVSKQKLPQANGIFFITVQASLIIGFGLAGILENIIGFRLSLVIASICLMAAFISVNLLPSYDSSKKKVHRQLEEVVESFFKELFEGYNFIKDNKVILFPFILLIILETMLSVILISLPAITTELLNVRAGSGGFLIILPAGFGAVVGTILVSKILAKGLRKKIVIERSITTFGIILLMLLLLPYINNIFKLLIGVVLFFLCGIFFVGALVPSLTILQERTPGGLLGRVFGNFWFLTTVVTVLPVFFSATLTDVLGVRSLLLSVAMVSFAGLAMSKIHERSIKL
jgi:predicted MFS family arabinose efflux permease